MSIISATKEDLLNTIENEAKIRIDSFVESAIELVEELHSDVKTDTSKSRRSATLTATWCTWATASAPSSAGTRS